jgi:serine/threonine-protein kinase
MAGLDLEPAPLTEVPPALWRVIRRALAKRPEDRFESAQDLAEALRSAVPGVLATNARASTAPLPPTAKTMPVAAVAPGSMPRRVRNRAGVGLAGAMTVACIALWHPSSSQVQPRAGLAPARPMAAAHDKRLTPDRDQVVLCDSPPESAAPSSTRAPRAVSSSSTDWIQRSAWEERARRARRRLALGGAPTLVRDPSRPMLGNGRGRLV